MSRQRPKDDYKLCIEACKHNGPQCYCPSESTFFGKIADTPEWLKRYFFSLGFQEGVNETEANLNVVSGEAAKKFYKETGIDPERLL